MILLSISVILHEFLDFNFPFLHDLSIGIIVFAVYIMFILSNQIKFKSEFLNRYFVTTYSPSVKRKVNAFLLFLILFSFIFYIFNVNENKILHLIFTVSNLVFVIIISYLTRKYRYQVPSSKNNNQYHYS